jgi:hypothetical protein
VEPRHDVSVSPCAGNDLRQVDVSNLWDLNIFHEATSQVLQHNPVGLCEERENHLNEVPFVIRKCFPVLQIMSKVYLFSCTQRTIGQYVQPGSAGVACWNIAQRRLLFASSKFVRAEAEETS